MGKRGILAYSGGALKDSGSELLIAGGGHADYAGNEVFSIKLADDSPSWNRRRDPSPAPAIQSVGVSHYPDGRPASRHTYWSLHVNNSRNLLMFVGAPALWSQAGYGAPSNAFDAFDLASNDYLPAGTLPASAGLGLVAQGIVRDPQDNVYAHDYSSGNLYRWSNSTTQWSNLGSIGPAEYETPYAYDSRRNRIFRVPTGSVPSIVVSVSGSVQTSRVDMTGPAAASIRGRGSLAYDPINDAFWFWKRNDNALYKIAAGNFYAEVQPVTGTPPNNTITAGGNHYTYGRFTYAPELRGLVFMRDESQDLYFIRIAP